MKLLYLALALVLVTPLASATIVSVATETKADQPFDHPFSDVYSMSFANTIFNPPPIFFGTVGINADFGEVAVNHVVHWSTNWTIGDGTTTVNVRIDGTGTKYWYGESTRDWTVSLNGTPMYTRHEVDGEFGQTFIYRDTHLLQFVVNTTMKVPDDNDGHLAWDKKANWASSAPSTIYGFESWGQHVTDNKFSSAASPFVGQLALLQDEHVDDAFSADNTSYTKFWLANLTAPTSWTVSTSYTDDTPDTLDVAYRFQTQATAIVYNAAADSCSWPTISKYIGFCPTLAGVAGRAAAFLPDIVGSLVSLVNPQWGDFFHGIGSIAAEFVSAYFFTLTLLAASPGKLFILVIATASGLANLIGALKGDLGTVVHLHIVFFKALSIAVFWYFYLYWLMVKYAFEMAVKLFTMFAQWAVALVPKPFGI